MFAAIDLDQERERDAIVRREDRRSRGDIERVGHQNEIASGLALDARRMGEFCRHDAGGAENVAIAAAGEILGFLQRRDRDAERRSRGGNARNVERFRGL